MDTSKSAHEEEFTMERPEVQKANEIIGRQYKVLDHGFIALVDYMGDDSSIVQAARVSYGKGTKSVRSDEGLIRYLLRHEHTTPFEMVEFKFLVRMPIFVARQWVRHRTASINEYSGRYSILKDEFYIPDVSALQAQSMSNRQGREPGNLTISAREEAIKEIQDISEKAYGVYSKLINAGVARELARIVLPVNVYTEWYWKSNLHNIMHFLSLRTDQHAQWEIRQYAVKMAEIVKTVVPIAYSAFNDFVLSGIRFSAKEQHALSAIIEGIDIEKACEISGIKLRKDNGSLVKSGEGPEFIEKMEKMKKSFWGAEKQD